MCGEREREREGQTDRERERERERKRERESWPTIIRLSVTQQNKLKDMVNSTRFKSIELFKVYSLFQTLFDIFKLCENLSL